MKSGNANVRPVNAGAGCAKRLSVLGIVVLALVARQASAQLKAPFEEGSQDLGTSPSYAVTLGDVDGDGDLDAFVVNYGTRNQVWLNDGTGLLASSGQDLAGLNSTDVALGDVDGDGDLDAFVTDYGGADRLWLNDGAGGFTTTTQTFPFTAGTHVVMGDLDGNGSLDLFVANYLQPDAVYLNDGKGTFTATGQALGNAATLAVALGDLDGDGDLDAMEANDNEPNKVWLNDGTGTFTATVQNLGSEASNDVALGDVDGDGDLDAYVANFLEPGRLWLNDGTGTFTATGQALGSFPSRSVSLGDVDHDGDLDAFIANLGEPNHVWLNDGAGTFTLSGQPLGNRLSTRAALGDLDGDGDLDAFVANLGQPDKVWFNRMIHRSVLFVDSRQALGRGNVTGTALDDFDKDGDLDIFVVNYNQQNKVLLNRGNGYFDPTTSPLSNTWSEEIASGDLDGDGDADAFEVNLFQPSKVWLNDGTGHFIDSGQALGAAFSYGIALGDLDGDGDLDAYIANFFGPNTVYRNDGTGVFTDSGQTLGNSDSYSVALGDLDGDGDLDAYDSNYGEPNKVWINDGHGTFADSGQNLGMAFSLGVALGDLDNDGDLDAFVVNTDEPNIVWVNNGSGVFTDSGQRLGHDRSYHLALGDLDNDGDLDAFVTNYYQEKVVWLNDGTGTFYKANLGLGVSDSLRVAVGDLDRDGDLDAFIGNYGLEDNKILFNCAGQFALPTTDTAPAAIVQGDSDAVLKICAVHKGRSGDSPMELATLELVLQEGPNDPLTSAEATAIMDAVQVYRDQNQSGAFEPASDTLVASVAPLALTSGMLTILFGDGDPEVTVDAETSRTYFIVVDTTANAASQSPNRFSIAHVTESSSTAEDSRFDIPLALEYAPNTTSTVVLIDEAYPFVTGIVRADPSPTSATTVPFWVFFSEPSWGVDAGDFDLVSTGVTGATVAGVAGGPSGYTVTVDVNPSDGELRLDLLDDNSIVDAMGFPLGGRGIGDGDYRTGEIYVFDYAPPAVSIDSITTDPTNIVPIPVTVTFSEAVVGFDASDIAVSSGSVSNFSGSGATYTFGLLVPAVEGLVTADVAAGAAQDLAGNDNTTAPQFSRFVDTVRPTVLLSSVVPDPTNATTIPVALSFSEPVAGFDAFDLAVSNATVVNLSGSGMNYSFDLVPTGQGLVTAEVPADAVWDAAGNGNAASAPLQRTFDSARPTIAMASVLSDPTNVSPIPVTLAFNEPVTGFDVSDLMVSSATLSGFAGSGTSYSFVLTPLAEGPLAADVAADAAYDAAGNGSMAAHFQRTYDTTEPNVSGIVCSEANPTSRSSVHFMVYFGEPVTGVDAADFRLTTSGLQGAAIARVGGSGNAYGVTVYAGVGEGTVRVDVVDDDSILDRAGNALGGAGVNNGDFTSGPAYLIDVTAPDTMATGPHGRIWYPNPVLPVSFSATETGSGLRAVHLFYRKDYSSHGYVRYWDGFTTSPILFDTRITGGHGTYELYTVGVDRAGNTEPVTGRSDAVFDFNVETRAGNWTQYR